MNVLKPGKNVITIWVEDTGGGGGLNEDPDNFYLQLGNSKTWLKVEARFKILIPKENIAPGINYASMQNQPGVLFNAMIAPILPYNIKGVIWYQGESNVPQHKEYRTLFPSLINGWRKRWKQPELPFLFAQLSSYNPQITEPVLSDWAYLREAQSYELQLPQTGMVVTIDVGDRTDLHPKRKKEVGNRLALNAFKIAYGFKDVINTGPAYLLSKKEGKSIHLLFRNTGSGLMIKGERLLGFSIAGADKNFVAADAVIKGEIVIVSNPAVAEPVYVRYAWSNAPLEANLFNREGLPAAPFRTDKD